VLEPDDRNLLLDALRPPHGSNFDYAIATTFTIDLETAVTVPLALAGFSLAGEKASSEWDPISITETLNAIGDSVDIFSQVGKLRLGRSAGGASPIVTLLEPILHEVRAPKPGHLFHPKVWVVRYITQTGQKIYRCLVLSRNLTQDRAWDLMLSLDSTPNVKKINTSNKDLARLIASLPERSISPLPKNREDNIRKLAEELNRVTWALPEKVQGICFYAFGVKGARNPKPEKLFRGYKQVVISPFVTSGGLSQVFSGFTGEKVTLISRPDQINQLDVEVLQQTDAFTLRSELALDINEGEIDRTKFLGVLDDLHAKLYVVESEKKTFIYIGSANATEAAFNGNTEILVELTAKPNDLGVDVLMAANSMFRQIIVEHEPDSTDTQPSDDQIIRNQLINYLNEVASKGFIVEMQTKDEGWILRVSIRDRISQPSGVLSNASLEVSTAFIPNESQPLDVSRTVCALFTKRALADVSPFLIIRASHGDGDSKVEESIAVHAFLIGAPVERARDVIVRLLDTPDMFLRFIFLMLALADGESFLIDPTSEVNTFGAGYMNIESGGVLETLLHALAKNPSSLDRLDAIVNRIIEMGDNNKVLPVGWIQLWSNFREAQSILTNRNSK